MIPALTNSTRSLINLSWLIKLRWVAVVGQILTIATVIFAIGIDLPLKAGLVVVIGLTALSNCLLMYGVRWAEQPQPRLFLPWEWVMGLIMVMDILSLTTLLFVSGGPNNPFFLYYFVNLSLSAMILSAGWAWSLNALAAVCFSWLLISHYEIMEIEISPFLRPISSTGVITTLQWGYWLAFISSCSVVVYFLTRLSNAVRQQDADLQRGQVEQASREKLEALGTMAAGAAHELATPLSTIAVVARDVEAFFDEHPLDLPGADSVLEDIHLIRSQLDRCRKILDRMASQSGLAIGETIQEISCRDFWESVLDEVSEPKRVHLEIAPEIASATLYVPPVILSQSMRGFVQNALDADPSGQVVQVLIRRFARHWLWTVTDRGTGMPTAVLQRVSEPFFTTKETGKGMGLGVYLAKNVVERLGGSIDYESELGQGTKVTIRLPRTFPSESDGEEG